jgi:hypothetical protein
MVVLDQLPLPLTVVLGNQPLTTEEEPLDEGVGRLPLVSGGLNDAAKLSVIEISEQECRPDDAAQLLKGLIEPVLPAVGPELAQQGQEQNLARPDREDHAEHVE